jgi:hypothetical protein
LLLVVGEILAPQPGGKEIKLHRVVFEEDHLEMEYIQVQPKPFLRMMKTPV